MAVRVNERKIRSSTSAASASQPAAALNTDSTSAGAAGRAALSLAASRDPYHANPAPTAIDPANMPIARLNTRAFDCSFTISCLNGEAYELGHRFPPVAVALATVPYGERHVRRSVDERGLVRICATEAARKHHRPVPIGVDALPLHVLRSRRAERAEGVGHQRLDGAGDRIRVQVAGVASRVEQRLFGRYSSEYAAA